MVRAAYGWQDSLSKSPAVGDSEQRPGKYLILPQIGCVLFVSAPETRIPGPVHQVVHVHTTPQVGEGVFLRLVRTVETLARSVEDPFCEYACEIFIEFFQGTAINKTLEKLNALQTVGVLEHPKQVC